MMIGRAVDVCSMGHVLPCRFVSNMWELSLLPLTT
jgi:hypothetical protein